MSPDAGDLLADFASYIARERFEGLPISTDHAVRAGLLPGPHKDSFDRLRIGIFSEWVWASSQ